MKVRALVADDEPLARRRLIRLLQQEPDAELVAVCGTGIEAVAAVRHHHPDLLFLDVQMPGLDGFAVVEALGADAPPAVVFVTAYDAYAIQAFEANALDYLLKPFDAERFQRAFERARERLRRPEAGTAPAQLAALFESLARPRTTAERLAIRAEGRVYFVRVADIDWIETASNYVRLHSGKTSHLLRESLSSLVTRLDPERFLRIHRTTVVNVERLRELQPWFSGEFIAILQDGTRLKVSRGYRDRVARWLGQSL
ncbi:MAG TPA: LytTR family DNA-binding domain-containing protein [Gemmatimonadales bacterium]|jgi:two-component system LytT family response regulator